LAIHIWTNVFVFHFHIRTRNLLIEGLVHISLILMALTLVANLLINSMLIAKYAAMGSAWAAVISWGLGTMVFPLFFYATRHVPGDFVRSVNPFYWKGLFGSDDSLLDHNIRR